MRRVRMFAAVAAVFGLGNAAQAQAQAQNCLTHAETTAMVGYALPDLLAGVRDKCKASLPPTAFLVARSAELEARYRTQADSLWPQAKAAFLKMVGEDEVVKKVPDRALRDLLTAGFSTAITDDIKVKDCPTADGLVESLAPLPPANLARMIGIILASESKGDRRGKSGFEICG